MAITPNWASSSRKVAREIATACRTASDVAESSKVIRSMGADAPSGSSGVVGSVGVLIGIDPSMIPATQLR